MSPVVMVAVFRRRVFGIVCGAVSSRSSLGRLDGGHFLLLRFPRQTPRLVQLLTQSLHRFFQVLLNRLFPVVETDHPETAVLDVILFDPQDVEPGRILGQRDGQLPRGEVNTRDRDRFWRISHENVSAERIVHEIPRHLEQFLIFDDVQPLQVHHNDLVRMFHVDAESQLLEDPPLRFDDVLLQGLVVHVQLDRGEGLLVPKLLNVSDDVDDITRPPRRFFYFRGQNEAGHGSYVEGESYKRFDVVKPVEQHAGSGHRRLREFEQLPRSLNQVAAKGANLSLNLFG